MASAQFVIAGIHAFTVASANLVHLAAREQIHSGKWISMPLFPTLPFFTMFLEYTPYRLLALPFPLRRT